MAMQEFDYYRQHNQITDQGKQVACYEDLPRDIASLVRVVQGLLISPYSALLHDFAYLNKCEVPGCDAWGDLITKPEADLTGDDLALLDHIADLTVNVDQQFATLRTLFEQTDYGRAVRQELAAVL